MGLDPLAPDSRACDDFVARLMETFGIPGLAIAIVGDGAVRLTQGYGSAELGSSVPVDELTVFGIGSNTKAFTAAALQILAQEGRLALDDPVEAHLSDFRLSDPYVSRHATIRDLLAHRCGFGAHTGDLLFVPPSSFSARKIVRRLRFVPLAAGFRRGFAYSNLTYIAAGEVIAATAGVSWESFVRDRLFGPLQMTGSVTTHAGLMNTSNRAAPHMRLDDVLRARGPQQPLMPVNQDNAGAATSISSSACDMGRWLTGLVNCGAGCAAEPILTQSAARELWMPQALVATTEPPAPLAALRPSFSAYGLGFRLYTYQGLEIAVHGGGTYGYTSAVAVIPNSRAAFAVLTNSDDATDAAQAAVFTLLDGSSSRRLALR